MRPRPILTLLAALALIGCRTRNAQPPPEAALAPAISPSEGGAGRVVLRLVPRAPADGADLWISRLVVGVRQVGDESYRFAQFGVAGNADYAEMKLCPLQGSRPCETAELLFTKVRLSRLEKGRYELRVRACVRPGRLIADAKPCSSWQRVRFDHRQPLAGDAAGLFQDKDHALTQLADESRALYGHLQKFAAASRREPPECTTETHSALHSAATLGADPFEAAIVYYAEHPGETAIRPDATRDPNPAFPQPGLALAGTRIQVTLEQEEWQQENGSYSESPIGAVQIEAAAATGDAEEESASPDQAVLAEVGAGAKALSAPQLWQLVREVLTFHVPPFQPGCGAIQELAQEVAPAHARIDKIRTQLILTNGALAAWESDNKPLISEEK